MAVGWDWEIIVRHEKKNGVTNDVLVMGMRVERMDVGSFVRVWP